MQTHNMEFEIPAGLTDLLQDFTVSVLREKPSDLVQFAAEYFNTLSESRTEYKYNSTTVSKKGVTFGASQDDEPMQTDSSEEEPEPPKNRFQRRKSVSAERYDPEADDDEGDQKVVYPKSDEQRKRLNEAIQHILIFRSLDQEQMQEVIDAMFERKVQPDDHVIDQGDDGDNFYVIASGTYDIYVKIDGQDKCVGNYEDQGSFGELALMYNMPRAATIVATSEGTLWAMDRSTFRRIVLKNAFNKRKMYEGLLENVPMLKTLESYERMNVADALQSQKFEDGHLIIRQGDTASCMYFIEEGEVRITIKQEGPKKTYKNSSNEKTEDIKMEKCLLRSEPCSGKTDQARHESNLNDPASSLATRASIRHRGPGGYAPYMKKDSSPEVEVTRCNKGKYFGELALLTHKPRAASAYAVGPVKCAVLDVQAFERLLGPCMDILKRNISDYEEQLVHVFGSKANISDLR